MTWTHNLPSQLPLCSLCLYAVSSLSLCPACDTNHFITHSCNSSEQVQPEASQPAKLWVCEGLGGGGGGGVTTPLGLALPSFSLQGFFTAPLRTVLTSQRSRERRREPSTAPRPEPQPGLRPVNSGLMERNEEAADRKKLFVCAWAVHRKYAFLQVFKSVSITQFSNVLSLPLQILNFQRHHWLPGFNLLTLHLDVLLGKT